MGRSTHIDAARPAAADRSTGEQVPVSGQLRPSFSTPVYLPALHCLRDAADRLGETFYGVVRHLAGDSAATVRLAPIKVRARAMRGSDFRSKSGVIALGGFIALGVITLAPQPASAQGLFGSLFGGMFQAPAERAPRYREERMVRSYAPPDYQRRSPLSSFGAPEPESRSAAPSASTRSGTGGSVHCVRTCDGRYFPVPRSVGGIRLDPAKVCTALCPAASTKVFHGSDMNYARANDGQRYSDLDNAFAFRDRIVPDCSCTGKGPGGLAQIDIESDPTLRAGDVVVTAEGPAVFNGARQFPYRTADFTPVEDYGKLNRAVREKLAEMQVNTGVTPVVPPQRIDVTKSDGVTRQASREFDDEPRRRASRAAREERYSHRPRYADPRAPEPQRYRQPQQAQQQPFPFFRVW